ncbi:aldose 1-epimerase isoform X2 [Eurytemora carolleeae]|nr:aldose 1-epimerase isoform X2 [Eurytemora carolleeae]|eukprot:XP_023336626.1 aldose 1-epimerase-like isoform X2 [Eurytemora affinis]
MVASVTYTLDNKGALDIKMKAVTDAETVVNLSNHVYINLAGHASGWDGLQDQILQIPHNFYTPDDAEYLPTGAIDPVENTNKDFQESKLLSSTVPQERGGEGFCVNYCIKTQSNSQSLAAVLSYPKFGRKLEVWSNQPGLELYTGNFLPGAGNELEGKDEARYGKWGGICLMTQNYRDAPNHPNFPSAKLNPGELYFHHATYKFL